jgi:spore maturation protein B
MDLIFQTIAQWAIPLILLVILGAGLEKKIPMYEVFVEGALEGIKIAVKLTPYILAIFVALNIFRVSGGLNFLVFILKPLLKIVPLPVDLLTLGILKPLSGSASLGITSELLVKHGPDSRLGLTASIIQGSSETTLYVLSLYLGVVHIKDSRHLVAIGLFSESIAFLIALLFGSLLSPV